MPAVLFPPAGLFVIMRYAAVWRGANENSSVKFERPAETADWQFVAETDDCMPDGNKKFSGFLTKDNGWRARAHIETTWGKPAASREKAVHNCLTDAIKLLGEVELTRLRRDAELERQR
jgi:hypothetical protein